MQQAGQASGPQPIAPPSPGGSVSGAAGLQWNLRKGRGYTMNVGHDLGFLAWLSNASRLDKLVIQILLGMSIVSWWHMSRKLTSFCESLHHADAFEKTF